MDIFDKELKLLKKYTSLLDGKSSRESLSSGYKDILHHYEELLNQATITTRISDRLQKRLDRLNEKLSEQNETLTDLNLKLREREKWLEQENEKSDKLLSNILNEKVIKDLKEGVKRKPTVYSNVTVFFSDLVGFTTISEQTEPGILVAELNRLFTKFDIIMKKHACDRIETIGDAYLAVCGMPVANEHHAENMLNAAIEILNYIDKRKKSASHCQRIEWKIRIGIHTGEVAGAVLGTSKYSYNIIGDTVNTASRMETNSEPMKINVSEKTFKLVKDKFQFIQREPIEVKGKGLLNMYFLMLN